MYYEVVDRLYMIAMFVVFNLTCKAKCVSVFAYLCFGGLETSSSLRQASSSCARVLGGGRGGMAGSWMNGWPGWWPRRWVPLPMPPPPQEE